MGRRLIAGLAAGAAGTTALNMVTYLDMALRGRPASEVPARTAGELADKAGLGLGESAGNRTSGLGALLGHLGGLGVGASYGVVRTVVRRMPWPVAALGLGAAAMAAGDAPPTALGVTDPKSWPPGSWLSDAIPHLAYGTITALCYEAFSADASRGRPSGWPGLRRPPNTRR